MKENGHALLRIVVFLSESYRLSEGFSNDSRKTRAKLSRWPMTLS